MSRCGNAFDKFRRNPTSVSGIDLAVCDVPMTDDKVTAEITQK